MFDLGMQELVVIFLVALIVFGPKKLPELGRTLGKWVIEIRRGINHARAQMEEEIGDDSLKVSEELLKNLPQELRQEQFSSYQSSDKQKDSDNPEPPVDTSPDQRSS